MEEILYSQCWEDPLLVKKLAITGKDTVLSITSGGCNSLYLLLLGPKRVISVDVNPAQNHLAELKRAAIEHFNYDELLGFLGILPMNDRLRRYLEIRTLISAGAMSFWDSRENDLASGILHSGRFEKYLAMFRKTALKLSQSKEKVFALMSQPNPAAQYNFYMTRWNTPLWRALFRIFFSRQLMQLLGRQKSFFKYCRVDDIGGDYLRKIESSVRMVNWSRNPYIEYVLTGNYSRSLPDYLLRKNVEIIRRNLGKIEFITADAHSYMEKMPRGAVTKINLSDIFECVSDKEFQAYIELMSRKLHKGARACYWNNLVRRINRNPKFKILPGRHADRVFFYQEFVIGEFS